MMPPSAEDRSVFGGWGDLAAAIMRWAAEASGVPGGAAAVDVLLGLAGVQSTQVVLLQSIKKNTDLIRGEHLKTAKLNLTQALRVGPDDPSWGGFLDQAQKGLFKAHSVAVDDAEKAVVEFNLFVVWALLGRDNHSRYWFSQSQASAERAVDELSIGISKHGRELGPYLKDVRPGRSPLRARSSVMVESLERSNSKGWKVAKPVVGVAYVALLFPTGPGLAGYLWLREKQVQPLVAALREFLKFYNALQFTATAWAAEPAPRFLELQAAAAAQGIIDRHVVLRQVPPDRNG
jgi:hypothetical protein